METDCVGCVEDLNLAGNVEDEAETWNDECIDDEIKQLLGSKENGKLITLDMVAHMEYFYNTLQCDNRTLNPFECPNSAKLFPALHCNLKTPAAAMTGALSLYQQHRTVIHPNTSTVKTQSQSGSNGKLSSSVSSSGHSSQAIAEMLLPKRYQWYPNIKIESPQRRLSISPAPKKISFFQRRSSALPGLSAMKNPAAATTPMSIGQFKGCTSRPVPTQGGFGSQVKKVQERRMT